MTREVWKRRKEMFAIDTVICFQINELSHTHRNLCHLWSVSHSLLNCCFWAIELLHFHFDHLSSFSSTKMKSRKTWRLMLMTLQLYQARIELLRERIDVDDITTLSSENRIASWKNWTSKLKLFVCVFTFIVESLHHLIDMYEVEFRCNSNDFLLFEFRETSLLHCII